MPSSSKYDLSPDEIAQILGDSATLQNQMALQASAEAALRAATDKKAQYRTGLVGILGATAKKMEANPQITDAMLKAIGFAPRPGKGVRPLFLAPVTNLVAEPFADGTVRLRWDRNGNGERTVFTIETSADGANWTMIRSTTRASFAAEGFAPGVAAWFRVIATNSTLASAPSTPASVYAPAAPAAPALRLA